MKPKLVYRRSYLIVLSSLAAGSISIWLAFRDPSEKPTVMYLMAIGGTLMLLASVSLFPFLIYRSSLRIKQHGVLIPTFDPDPIPWDLIDDVHPLRSQADTELKIILRPGYCPIADRIGFVPKRDRLPARDSHSEWSVDCKEFGTPVQEIASLITRLAAMDPEQRKRTLQGRSIGN